jgi:precorrin-4 methylase
LLADIAQAMRESRIERTSVILVGTELGAEDFRESCRWQA